MNIQKKEVFSMFYIDFTSPEGKAYRIDVSKNPVIYECPVCGHITIYEFDPEDENCCDSCVEQRRIQKEKERKAAGQEKRDSLSWDWQRGLHCSLSLRACSPCILLPHRQEIIQRMDPW